MSEELLTSKLGPVVFKIVLEQQKIADIFLLLKKFFRCLPSNDTGREASKEEVGNALLDLGLLTSEGIDRFKVLQPRKEGQTSFQEFVGFMVSEYTIKQKSIESGETKEEKKSVDTDLISEELHAQLAPLAFRIGVRSDEMTRIFGLFQDMFTIFDLNKNGIIQRKEMDKLVEAGLFQADDLKSSDEEPGEGAQLNFNQFIGLWMNKYIEEDQEQESVLKSKLGPLVFKIALSQQSIKAAVNLLQHIYDAFDPTNQGLVNKDAFAAFGFVSSTRLSAWPTKAEGSLTFVEFGAFYASEFALGEFEGKTEEKKNADISLELAQKLAPHLFRLSARTEELNRIFGLFKNMFDVFDKDNDGKIDKQDLAQLREADFLKESEIDGLSSKPLEFPGFMGFWVTHYLEGENKMEERERGKELTAKEKKLFPRLFRLDCQRENVTKIFQLLKEIFDILDEKKTGSVPKSEVLKMIKIGFLEGAGQLTLENFKCTQPNHLSFGEFLLWIVESQTT